MAHERDAPGEREETETDHHVEHAVGIEMAGGGEVGVDGERRAVEKDEENGATKPGHLRLEEADGFFAMFRREPVGFVGEIDAFGRLVGENAGSDEGDERREAKDHEHESEESLLGLIAVGGAVGGEMRGHDIGKLRIEMSPLEQAKSEQNDEE